MVFLNEYIISFLFIFVFSFLFRLGVLFRKGHKKGPVSNGTCVFPFKHNGIENFMCKDPKDYAGVGWCSLDSEYEGRWGYCSSNCPKDYDDPCKEIVCNIAGEKCVNGQCKCGSACSCEFNPAGQSCDPDKSICK